MKEELYIIVNDERVPLDLNTPSGITLNYESNMFKDLGKISSSYSYTFKLPMTQRNSRAFDMAEDPRHESGAVRKKLKAEYLRNGYNITGRANLYIDTVENGYSCVLTWGVIDGLVEMNQEDLSIQKLVATFPAATDQGSAFYLPESAPSYSKTGTGEMGLNWTNISVAYMPTVEAGVPYVKNWARTYHNADSVEDLIPYGGEEYTAEFSTSGIHAQKKAAPLPVVNLRHLIGLIEQRYNLGIDFYKNIPAWTYTNLLNGYSPKDNQYDPTNSCASSIYTHDLLNAGCVPCVTSERTKIAAANKITFSASVVTLKNIGLIEGVAVFGVFGQHKFSYAYDTLQAPQYRDIEMATQTSTGGYSVLRLKHDAKLKISGYINTGLTKASTFTLTKYSEAGVTGTDYKTFKKEGNGYEFREEFGGSTQEVFLPMGDYLIRFPQFGGDISSSGLDVPMNFNLTIEPVSEDGQTNVWIETFNSLPELKCMELLKALFYAIGAYPLVDSKGKVSIGYYDTLGKNKNAGNAMDWSGKMLVAQDCTIKYTAGDFRYRNYYLMKNEELEAKDKEDTADEYSSPMFNVVCPNALLDKKQTVFQFPFTGKYLKNGDYQTLPTGDTMKYWDKPRIGALSAKASAAVLGITYLRPVKTILSNGAEEYRGERALSVEMWDTSMLNENASYKYLASMLENMVSVKAKFRLDESDLMELDYTRPVYLDKYNAYFAVVSITVQNEISTVELIKLP